MSRIEALVPALHKEIRSQVVRPGDTLLLVMKRRLSDQEHHEIHDRLMELLPERLHVLLLTEVDEIRVYRPESDEDGM